MKRLLIRAFAVAVQAAEPGVSSDHVATSRRGGIAPGDV
jgi:hypothetical protein